MDIAVIPFTDWPWFGAAIAAAAIGMGGSLLYLLALRLEYLGSDLSKRVYSKFEIIKQKGTGDRYVRS